jgi:hypothetical protein
MYVLGFWKAELFTVSEKSLAIVKTKLQPGQSWAFVMDATMNLPTGSL